MGLVAIIQVAMVDLAGVVRGIALHLAGQVAQVVAEALVLLPAALVVLAVAVGVVKLLGALAGEAAVVAVLALQAVHLVQATSFSIGLKDINHEIRMD